jgi:hypothetical protein
MKRDQRKRKGRNEREKDQGEGKGRKEGNEKRRQKTGELYKERKLKEIKETGGVGNAVKRTGAWRQKGREERK